VQDFRGLKVWQKAHQVALGMYAETGQFPSSELYGLRSQMRRAAVSIGSNIAEGCCRDPGPEFARFLQMAMGSASELEYQLLLSHDLHFMAAASYERLSREIMEVKRMLATLIPKVRRGKRRADNEQS
jgi:four helix bundle protein